MAERVGTDRCTAVTRPPEVLIFFFMSSTVGDFSGWVVQHPDNNQATLDKGT